jgi:hypothetical protein
VYELPSITAGNTPANIGAIELQLILQGIVLSSVKKKIRFSLSK